MADNRIYLACVYISEPDSVSRSWIRDFHVIF
jgi:hypothetical protein